MIVGGEDNVFVEHGRSDNTRLARLVRHTDRTWDHNASVPSGIATAQPSAVNVNGRLTVVQLGTGTPDVSELGADGKWSDFTDVPTDGHKLRAAAAVAHGDTLRVVELDGDGRTNAGWSRVDTTLAETGGLYHTIRHADGTWQEPGDVAEATGGAAFNGPVTIAGV